MIFHPYFDRALLLVFIVVKPQVYFSFFNGFIKPKKPSPTQISINHKSHGDIMIAFFIIPEHVDWLYVFSKYDLVNEFSTIMKYFYTCVLQILRWVCSLSIYKFNGQFTLNCINNWTLFYSYITITKHRNNILFNLLFRKCFRYPCWSHHYSPRILFCRKLCDIMFLIFYFVFKNCWKCIRRW